MSKIIVIDGNSLLFRAFYATYYDPSNIMRTKSGQATNAIFAFSNMITSILSTLKKGDGIFVAFDAGKQTFRHKEFKEYFEHTRTLEEVKDKIKVHSRQYAKRQYTWFKNQMKVHWFDREDEGQIVKSVKEWLYE